MPEQWKEISGFGGYYEVSDAGGVRSTARRVRVNCGARATYERPVAARLLRAAEGAGGYPSVTLWKEHCGHQKRVHVLVLEAFIGPRPKGLYACHRDGRPQNNRLDNLYWGTPTQNAADKRRHGTHLQGSAIGWAKLSEADVRHIRSLKGRVTQSVIARQYGTRQGHISRVMNGKQWRHVPLEMP